MKTNTTMAKKKAPKKTKEYGMNESKLMELFEDELKDIYWAKKR